MRICFANLNTIYVFSIEGKFYRSNGNVIPSVLIQRLWEMFEEWENGEGEGVPNSGTPGETSNSNAYVYLRSCLEQNLARFPKEDHEAVRSAFNCMMNYCQMHNGGFLESAPRTREFGPDSHWQLPGGNLKIPAGFGNVLSALKDNFWNERRLRLGREVTRITWDGYEIRIRCTNDEEYLAEHVILTVSLGCLRKWAEQGTLKPQMPETKLEAIRSIEFGKANKVFLFWDTPFWEEGSGSIKLAWTDQEYDIKSPKEWYKRIFGFDEVLNNRNVLVGWISGNEAEVMESLLDDDIIETCTQLIRQFLGNPAIPRPSKIIRSNWCSNPFTLGSYSYRGFQTTSRHHQQLSEPMYQALFPRILFAGEATSTHHNSTMHGARDSAFREVKRLLEYYDPGE